MKKTIHLVCNAHLDPVWLWEWEEGAAEAVSTFRVAADLCEACESFVFNHNEVILYEWVEAYEPELFRRIQRLVKAGRWHIMGGWYLQPDCNMPSGESFVRQILLGRQYFDEKFGVRPTTAINFDPFGHTRGLVQILRKSGYDSYIVCRPDPASVDFLKDQMTWVGYDGSQVAMTRCSDSYLSLRGQARAKVERKLVAAPEGSCQMVLWGVGNHGGGPSRQDLQALCDLIASTPDVEIKHSTPEAYFAELAKGGALPLLQRDMNPWGVGCYTSQIRIKQHHRLLENELFAAEKMVSAAWVNGIMVYPADELREISKDLATAQFHDILPGTSIQPVEDSALRGMSHGLEVASRIKARAFFALSAGQTIAKPGEIPVLVYNPHPFAVQTTVACELQLADQNRSGTFTNIEVFQGDRLLPSQVEQEASNIKIDWRKRVVFIATLAPSQMNRFDCRLTEMKQRPVRRSSPKASEIRFYTDELQVTINTRTGLMDRFAVGGKSILAPAACRPLVMKDNADPWGMTVKRFRTLAGRFRLLSRQAAGAFAGLDEPLDAVRVIEDGPARMVVEALFGYNNSFICQRYLLPRVGREIEVEIQVLWLEKDRMLKLALPTLMEDGLFEGQVAYGMDRLPANGDEAVAQKWVSVSSQTSKCSFTCINDGSYGSDCFKGELRLSLLRSPGYSAHPIETKQLMPENRFSPRIDQGERLFRFWISAGERAERMASVDREALVHNEKPMALSFFPSGSGQSPRPLVVLDDDTVQVTAVKKAEKGDSLIVRLFEPTGCPRTTTVSLPFARMRKKIRLGKFEIKTLKVNLKNRTWQETDLLE